MPVRGSRRIRMRLSTRRASSSCSAAERSSGSIWIALGRRFILVTPGLTFKLFPVCSGAQPATEALIRLIEEEKLDRELITHVHCEVTRDIMIYLEHESPVTLTEAQFSMTFPVACVLVHGELGVAQLSEEVLFDARVREAMGKVEMTLNEGLAEASDLGPAFPEAAVVTVTLADGRSFSKLNKTARGTPLNPMPDEQIDRKFLDCAGLVLGAEAAQALLQRIRNVDTLSTSNALFADEDRDGTTAAARVRALKSPRSSWTAINCRRTSGRRRSPKKRRSWSNGLECRPPRVPLKRGAAIEGMKCRA